MESTKLPQEPFLNNLKGMVEKIFSTLYMVSRLHHSLYGGEKCLHPIIAFRSILCTYCLFLDLLLLPWHQSLFHCSSYHAAWCALQAGELFQFSRTHPSVSSQWISGFPGIPTGLGSLLQSLGSSKEAYCPSYRQK